LDDPQNWSFDVLTSPHDDVKQGILCRTHSRISISREAFPDWRIAAQVAGCMAVARHGGMPTSILIRL
jgi:hypothetical protein